MSTVAPPRPPRLASPLPSSAWVAGRLALQLWLASSLCCWIVGMEFARLWWLVNEDQLSRVLFRSAWQVPAVGWTGAVLIPWLRLRRLIRQLPDGHPDTARRVARFPLFLFWVVLGTSTFGYALGALQVADFAALPIREVVGLMIQGPALGGLFAVGGYLLAERAVRDLSVPPAAQMARGDLAVEPVGFSGGDEAAADPPGPEVAATTPGAEVRPRVLLVDDERSIRLALGRYLRRNGWEVDEAGDGEEALGLLHRTPADGYDLVITDLRMPVLSGFEVHDWVAEHRPDLFARLVIATGDVRSQPVREFLGRTSRPVLEKPFELSALSELVEKVRGR